MGTAFMSRDVIGPIALDFVLGIIFRGMMDMTFIVEVAGVDGDDRPRHPARLGIPAYVIANLESLGHGLVFSLRP